MRPAGIRPVQAAPRRRPHRELRAALTPARLNRGHDRRAGRRDPAPGTGRPDRGTSHETQPRGPGPAPGARGGLGRTGLPARNPHEGHDMPGMATPDELAALGAATGGAFDRLFLTRLSEHVEQTALVSRSEQVSGADRATRDLAAAIVRSRTAERGLLNEIETGSGH
ncbi:DUF305 domain-containing protein [Nonomuraea angiospora]|uniref:DUF305 domain-containing protein n=1 Tax=Nonomuraea angiospora TaxID=46172 RepID=UPI0033D68B79